MEESRPGQIPTEYLELHRTVFTWTICNFMDRVQWVLSDDVVYQNGKKIIVNKLSSGKSKKINNTSIYMGHNQEIKFDIELHGETSEPGTFSIQCMVRNIKNLSKLTLEGFVIISNDRIEEFMNVTPTFFPRNFAAVECDFQLASFSNQNQDYLLNDTFSILCACSIFYKIQNPKKDYYDLSASIVFLCSHELQSLFENREDSDVTVSCEGVEFEAHKAILSFHSAVFSSMFEQETEKATQVIVIEDVEKYIMIYLLDYMYGNDIFHMRLRTIIAIYSAANKYAILDLKRYCSKILEMCLSYETVCELTLLAEKNNDDKLFHAADRFVRRNRHEFIKCEFFKDFAQKHPESAQSLVISTLMY